MSFDEAARIADAVLYEGYALYPYRPSSVRNKARWQFGVLMPRDLAEASADSWRMQMECLIEPEPDADTRLDLRFRCLHLKCRTIAVEQAGEWTRVSGVRLAGRDLVEWDEGVERAVDLASCSLAQPTSCDRALPFAFERSRETEQRMDDEGRTIRIVHECRPVNGSLRASARRCGPFVKLQVTVENVTGACEGHSRDETVQFAMVGSHLLAQVHGGRFVSPVDPPEGAADLIAACQNVQTWPVLVGDRSRCDLLLSAPIILYDFPTIAPESPGDLFDSTEIDEILSLRVMTLTDEEKREARGTDARVAGLIDRTETLARESLASLHGAIREVQPVDDRAWRELLNPPGEAPPEEAIVEIAGARVARGSRVRLEPTRRADAIDLFVRGRTAFVEAIHRDLDGRTYLAVRLEDDPAGELHASWGRFLYYGAEEVVPL